MSAAAAERTRTKEKLFNCNLFLLLLLGRSRSAARISTTRHNDDCRTWTPSQESKAAMTATTTRTAIARKIEGRHRVGSLAREGQGGRLGLTHCATAHD